MGDTNDNDKDNEVEHGRYATENIIALENTRYNVGQGRKGDVKNQSLVFPRKDLVHKNKMPQTLEQIVDDTYKN